MKSVLALVVAFAASMVSAGVVITPVRANQVVPKNADDCFFGVTTPVGCAYVTPKSYPTTDHLKLTSMNSVLRA